MVNLERHVGDGQTHLQEHLLVEGLHLGNNLLGDGEHIPESMATLGRVRGRGGGVAKRRFGDMYPVSVNICTIG